MPDHDMFDADHIYDFKTAEDVPPPRPPSPYHPQAHGLNGEMLDGMLKASFTEGTIVATEELSRRFVVTLQGAQEQARVEGAAQGTTRTRRAALDARQRCSSAFRQLYEGIGASRMSAATKKHLLRQLGDIDDAFTGCGE